MIAVSSLKAILKNYYDRSAWSRITATPALITAIEKLGITQNTPSDSGGYYFGEINLSADQFWTLVQLWQTNPAAFTEFSSVIGKNQELEGVFGELGLLHHLKNCDLLTEYVIKKIAKITHSKVKTIFDRLNKHELLNKENIQKLVNTDLELYQPNNIAYSLGRLATKEQTQTVFDFCLLNKDLISPLNDIADSLENNKIINAESLNYVMESKDVIQTINRLVGSMKDYDPQERINIFNYVMRMKNESEINKNNFQKCVNFFASIKSKDTKNIQCIAEDIFNLLFTYPDCHSSIKVMLEAKRAEKKFFSELKYFLNLGVPPAKVFSEIGFNNIQAARALFNRVNRYIRRDRAELKKALIAHVSHVIAGQELIDFLESEKMLDDKRLAFVINELPKANNLLSCLKILKKVKLLEQFIDDIMSYENAPYIGNIAPVLHFISNDRDGEIIGGIRTLDTIFSHLENVNALVNVLKHIPIDIGNINNLMSNIDKINEIAQSVQGVVQNCNNKSFSQDEFDAVIAFPSYAVDFFKAKKILSDLQPGHESPFYNKRHEQIKQYPQFSISIANACTILKGIPERNKSVPGSAFFDEIRECVFNRPEYAEKVAQGVNAMMRSRSRNGTVSNVTLKENISPLSYLLQYPQYADTLGQCFALDASENKKISNQLMNDHPAEALDILTAFHKMDQKDLDFLIKNKVHIKTIMRALDMLPREACNQRNMYIALLKLSFEENPSACHPLFSPYQDILPEVTMELEKLNCDFAYYLLGKIYSGQFTIKEEVTPQKEVALKFAQAFYCYEKIPKNSFWYLAAQNGLFPLLLEMYHQNVDVGDTRQAAVINERLNKMYELLRAAGKPMHQKLSNITRAFISETVEIPNANARYISVQVDEIDADANSCSEKTITVGTKKFWLPGVGKVLTQANDNNKEKKRRNSIS